MKEQNGIQIFEEGDSFPALPRGLSADIPVRARFGFKVVEEAGKAYWDAATEADYRTSEAKRLSINQEAVDINPGCIQYGPQTCFGDCSPAACRLLYNPATHYYYCACVAIP